MNAQELRNTTSTLVAGVKGLLAMGESNPTCNKRIAALGISQIAIGPTFAGLVAESFYQIRGSVHGNVAVLLRKAHIH